MSLIKSLAGQTLVYGLGHILPRVLHFVVFNSYLTYKWNDQPVEYAVYLDLYAYASILIIVFSFRMDTAMFRFAKKEADLETTYTSAIIPLVVSSFFLLCGGFFFAERFASALTYPGKGYYIQWFAMIIAFDVIALLPYARYRLVNKAFTFIQYKILNVILTVALVFFFLEIIPRYWPGLLQNWSFIQSDVDFVFLSNLIASLVIMITLMVNNKPSKWVMDWVLWKKMIKYSWPLIIVGVAGSINQFFAVPLQKFFLGAEVEINKEQAAVYGAVQKLAALLAMFTTAYNYAAEPFFFRNSEAANMKKLYGDIAIFFLMAAGCISLGIFLFIDVFQFVIGSHFRQGLYLLPILLMAYLFLGLYYNVSIWYKLDDKTLYGAIIASVGAFITLSGSIVFLPHYGVVASAWTALACYVVMVLLAYFSGQRYYPIEYSKLKIIKHLSLIVGIMAIGFCINQENSWINIISGAVLFLLYVGLLYLMERSLFKQYFG